MRWLTDPDGLFALTLSRRIDAEGRQQRGPRGLAPAVQIEGSAAIVSGGASGLGGATVRALHERGAVVTIADVNAEKGEALASELGVAFVACDVREEDQVQAAVQKAAERRGRAADRDVLRRHRLGAEGRGLQGAPPAAALRDDHRDQPDRHVQRCCASRPAR